MFVLLVMHGLVKINLHKREKKQRQRMEMIQIRTEKVNNKKNKNRSTCQLADDLAKVLEPYDHLSGTDRSQISFKLKEDINIIYSHH